MDALEELKVRLDAVVRQLQEALKEAIQTRSEVESVRPRSKVDEGSTRKPPDEPVKT